MEILKIKEDISKNIDHGEVSSAIINLLSNSGKFLKKETSLWDYKRELDTSDKISVAEIIKDIIAFHNTFGGYLFIGVDDDGGVCTCEKIEEKTIKTHIYNYTNSDIDITCQFLDGINLIHIPKRESAKTPVAISKLGPEKNKKSVFKPGEIYFRAEDSSSVIRNDKDLSFLLGTRTLYSPQKTIISTNNLPEKSSIIEIFIGREQFIQQLNEWLIDPFKKYMLLAGPGGVGKTSIAYSFCENLCTHQSVGMEQVVWISAKNEQFSAIKNQSIPLPYNRDSRNHGQYYSDISSLIDAISYHFPIIDSEWEGLDFNLKLQLLIKYAGSIKSFIVIDDLDSLSIDDQRQAIQLAMYFGQTENRFLFTTRKNFLAPASNTIEVTGLKDKDFSKLIENLTSNFKISLNPKQIVSLEKETDGSPLLTESIFRLLKLGDSFDTVIERWRGKDGEVARAKAFEREISQLSFNSKTVLFAISLSESLSKSELIRVTELSANEVEESYLQLEQLFLVSVKSIGDQPRYSISSTQKRAIRDIESSLISTANEIKYRFFQLRQESKQALSKGNDKEIGLTIQQAIAQISAQDYIGAVSTVSSKIEKIKDNADLWMLYGRCLSLATPIDLQATRSAFEKSFFYGKREFQLFDLWLNFEMQYGNSNSAIDVVKKGSTQHNSANWQWLRLCSLIYYKRGSERAKRSDYRDAINDFEKSAKNITKILQICPSSIKREIIEISQEINNSILICFNKTSLLSEEEKIQILSKIIKNGEKRENFYLEILESIKLIKSKNLKDPSRIEELTNSFKILYALRNESRAIDSSLSKILNID